MEADDRNRKSKFLSTELIDKFTKSPLRIGIRNKDGDVINLEIFADSSQVININYDGGDLQTGEIDQIAIAFKTWWMALHWFVKSEDKKHIIPRKGVKKTKFYEPTEIYLKHIFTLCEGCQSRKNFFDWDLPTDNVVSWPWLIWEEIMGEEIFYVLNQHKDGVRKILELQNVDYRSKSLSRNLKRGYIRGILLPKVEEAENYKNPYPIESLTDEKQRKSGYYYRAILMQSAIKLSQELSEFQAKYYKPFIKAWRDSIVAMESSDYFLLQLKDGDLRVQNGKSSINLSQKFHS